MEKNFEAAFTNFLEVAKDIREQAGVKTPELTFEIGRKYIRVVSNNYGGRSVYCFIDLEHGHILKSASWKVPAKGIRGSIFADDHGRSAINSYGAHYYR